VIAAAVLLDVLRATWAPLHLDAHHFLDVDVHWRRRARHVGRPPPLADETHDKIEAKVPEAPAVGIGAIHLDRGGIQSVLLQAPAPAHGAREGLRPLLQVPLEGQGHELLATRSEAADAEQPPGALLCPLLAAARVPLELGPAPARPAGLAGPVATGAVA